MTGRILLRGVAVTALALACACSDDEPSATPAAADVAQPDTTAPAPAEQPRALSAGGEQTTASFPLAGGDYTAAYSFGGECYYSVDLEASGSVSAGTGNGPVEGTTNVYGLRPGDYHLQVITGPDPDCPWTVTLTPVG